MRAPYDPSKPLDGLTRRSLLLASGVTGATALLAGCSGMSLDDVLRRGDQAAGGAASASGAGTPILVVVTLYGGNDGLNTVVPYADPAYHSARPELAYPAEQVLRLDDTAGLNPSLPTFAAAWRERQLAVVRGVGYPKPDHSHFRSMDIWQTASPDHPVGTGWLGRWLDAEKGDPLLAVSLGETLPPLAVGEGVTAVALTDHRAARRAAAVERLETAYAVSDPADPPAMRAASEAYAALRRSSTVLSPIAATPAEGRDGEAPATGTGGHSDSSIEGQLALVATCIRAGVPTRAYVVSQPGFDSHTQERAQGEFLLSHLDAAVKGFRAALAGTPREKDVVMMIHSEFGRRVRANASQGTDHGTASNVLLLGHRVSPGFHGEQPSLTDLVDGDLKVGIDFRSVYGEIAEKLLGVGADRVVPSPQRSIGVLA